MQRSPRSVANQSRTRTGPRAEWVKAVEARRGFNRAVVALANKTARAAWAVLARGEEYRAA